MLGQVAHSECITFEFALAQIIILLIFIYIAWETATLFTIIVYWLLSLHRQDRHLRSVKISNSWNLQITHVFFTFNLTWVTVYCCVWSNGSSHMFNLFVGTSEVGVLMCWSWALTLFPFLSFPFLLRKITILLAAANFCCQIGEFHANQLLMHPIHDFTEDPY